ncbi:related to ferric-chelate reductase [Cephalotrichum gorgonifer]|uniref:ferric-chelate reductase (NADPH) n=1 Tax=Cephalotrichum gorgonifer TaxID=2041049 RepID=A0AAE8MWL8_9PEZI|nr:related to ferric-chelate reductase [Cephalotrichum gorgonifer]
MHGEAEVSKGLPWFEYPLPLHSSRADKCKLTAEQCAYRAGHWRYWYVADWVYALGTIYFILAIIALSLIGFWTLKLAPASLRKKSWWQKIVGVFRFASYRRYDIKVLRYQTPSIAVSVLLVIGALFFSAMTLGPKPILATKTNMIALLTGVSHERLMVFHIWVGWAMFVLALIHTFPFIIYHIWKGDMEMEWKMSLVYWSGVACLIPQGYLTFMSLPWIRNYCYEFFKATHFLAAVFFMVFFFIHCGGILTSWDYFIAAGALYSVSWLYSQTRTYLANGISLRATLTPASDHVLKITIPVGTMRWQPGQHVFLRFLTLGVHALTAHPFTICSAPSEGDLGGKGNASRQSSSTLVFYVQPRGGLTGRLAKLASQRPGLSVPVLAEGPYGGIMSRPLHTYDQSLVVACGAGAGFSIPFVISHIRNEIADLRASKSDTDSPVDPARRLRVLISTRDQRLPEWYDAALAEYLEENSLPVTLNGVEILIHLTSAVENGVGSSSQSCEQVEEKSPADSVSHVAPERSSKLPFKLLSGRPDLSAVVRDATLQTGVSVGIAVCGPKQVLKAVQDEAAAAQLRILNSEAGSKEVYLHSESFS